MPQTQRGQAYRLGPNRWGLRYYDTQGVRRRKSPFGSKSAALTHYRNVIEPELRGETPMPNLTLAGFVPLFLERHAATVRPGTLRVLRDRLGYAVRAYGDVPLRELEGMSGELASWRATLSEGSRYQIMSALRQALGAAERWGYVSRNPARLAGANPQPPARSIRVFSPGELAAIAAELPPAYQPLPAFAAATGLRPEEWSALERGDIDRANRVLTVRRTVSEGADSRCELVDLAKTGGSIRQVPLPMKALQALDELTPRLDTRLLFPAPEGGILNLGNFRRREWTPAIKASGVRRPARIYDLRSTFASNAIAARVSVFPLAKVMGTSVKMIERHYGRLLDGAAEEIVGRLDAFDSRCEEDTDHG